MDYKNIILAPKSFSNLLLSYFYIFFKNYKLLISFNLIVLIAFYFIVGKVETNFSSENYLSDYFNKSSIYALFFTIPAAFISTFYLTLLADQKPSLKTITSEFLKSPFKIIISSFILCVAIFIFNLVIKSQFLVFQYSGPIPFFITEIIYCILSFTTIVFIFYLNPYHAQLKQLFSKKTIKYLGVLFLLMLLSLVIYRLGFNLLILLIDIFTDVIGINQPDLIYNSGIIVIEYINEIAIFTILLFCYYNYIAEIKNTFHLDEINQIKPNENETEEL